MATTIVRHRSHDFPRTQLGHVAGCCRGCSVDPQSVAATVPCAAARADPRPIDVLCPHCGRGFPSLQALGPHRAACTAPPAEPEPEPAPVLCTVCDEPAEERYEVQIREGGPSEELCRACLLWLRDAFDAALAAPDGVPA